MAYFPAASVAIGTGVAALLLAVTGCANPNDPRINPKMRYSLEQQVVGELNAHGYAVSPRDYRVFQYQWRNPKTRRREVLTLFVKQPGIDAPSGFVFAYDLDFDRRCGLRPDITSVDDSWSLPSRTPAAAPAPPAKK